MFELNYMPAATYAAVVEMEPDSYDPLHTLTVVVSGVIRFHGAATRDHGDTVRFTTK